MKSNYYGIAAVTAVIVWLVISILLLSGCCRIKKGDFSYTRVGKQHIEGVLTSPDGTKIVIIHDADTGAIIQAIKSIDRYYTWPLKK